MELAVHLTFGGSCEAAFRFYEEALHGHGLSLFRYEEGPLRGQILHAGLKIGERQLLGADVSDYQSPRGFFVFHAVADRAEAERIFARLAEGGSVGMPLQQTFWSPCFGVVTDRFGTPWEITLR
jgi:PhnB protein